MKPCLALITIPLAMALGMLVPTIKQTSTPLLSMPISKTESPGTTNNADPDLSHEDLDALVWMQSSAEYEAIARQTFRLARLNMGDALVDPTWTASVEQQVLFSDRDKELAALPPAVIVDVDETVLDNTSYQCDLIRNNEQYTRDSWTAFVKERVSRPVPGSVEFVQACRSAGVTVLFVTNREFSVEDETRRNLTEVGLMKKRDPDALFTKYEKEGWNSDKQSRREHLASRYRILLLVGDDLNDFLTIKRQPTSQERKQAAVDYAKWWGQKWMVLPNPNYGGWERSAYQWKDSSSPATKLKLKRKAMRRDQPIPIP